MGYDIFPGSVGEKKRYHPSTGNFATPDAVSGVRGATTLEEGQVGLTGLLQTTKVTRRRETFAR